MIFGKKSCAPSDGLGFRQGQNIVHNVCGRKLGLIVQMAVDVRRGADVAGQPEHWCARVAVATDGPPAAGRGRRAGRCPAAGVAAG